MLRHVYIARQKRGVDVQAAEAWYTELGKLLETPGLLHMDGGADIGIREGNFSFATVTDFESADAWRAWDQAEEHQRIRREMAAPIFEEGHRIQFESPETRPHTIRNITMIWTKPGTSDAEIDGLRSALGAMSIAGTRNLVCGRDLGLREGNAQICVVCDFDDEEGYRVYDADGEHNRIRREVAAPITQRIERVQYRSRG